MKRLIAIISVAALLTIAGAAASQTGNGYRWPRFSLTSPVTVKYVTDSHFDQGMLPFVQEAFNTWTSTGDLRFVYAGGVSDCYGTYTAGGICFTTVNNPTVWWWGFNELVTSRTLTAPDAKILDYAVIRFNAWYVSPMSPPGMQFITCHEQGEAVGLHDHLDTNDDPSTYAPTCLSGSGYPTASSEDLTTLHAIYQHVDSTPPPTCRKKHC